MATFSSPQLPFNIFSWLPILLFFGLFLANVDIAGAQSIGVCYGLDGNNLPPKGEVIALYKSRNIGRLRLYFPDQAVLQALRGSNIQVLLGVQKDRLQELASNPAAATAWVQTNVRNYWPDVRFRYIVVGNEEIPNGNAGAILPAMRNIRSAIVAAGLQAQIKVSTAIDTGVLGASYPPSAGAFTNGARGFLEPIARFLTETGAPLLANVYPYFSHKGNPRDVPLDYALFTRQSVIQDGQYQYRNLFDAILDAMYAALEKVGAASLEIVVSESGWPSAGWTAATVGNAQTYNQNLIRHVGRGSPRRPGRAIETYIFAMFNENLKAAGEEQNFGLFYPNKQPVYPITF